MLYKFEAMDATGLEVVDEVEATSQKEAQEIIKEMGYFVTKISKSKKTTDLAYGPELNSDSTFLNGLYVGAFAVVALEAVILFLWLMFR